MSSKPNRMFLVSVPESVDETHHFVSARNHEEAALVYVKAVIDHKISTLANLEHGSGDVLVVQVPNVQNAQPLLVPFKTLRPLSEFFSASDLVDKIRGVDASPSM